MRTALIAMTLALLPGCATSPVAPPNAAGESSLSLEASAAALDAAISGKDRAALERLLADDLLWIRGSGKVAGKADFIGGLTDPALSIEPFRPSSVRWFRTGSSGMITGENVLRGTAGGTGFVDRHRFADRWELRNGQWKLVYVQVTPVPEAPPQ